RLAVDKARGANMPKDTMVRAIARGAGGGDDASFDEVVYEGYGPGGAAVMVDCLTDNNNRTIKDVRNCFTKTHAKIGGPGTVSHMFDHVAIFVFKHDDEEAVLELLMMADVDVTDIENEDGMITVYAPHLEFYKAKTALTSEIPDIQFEVEEVTFESQTTTKVEGDDVAMFEKFLAMLEDCDDVQEVYHNAEF
ncbi:MAG: YebC/PmpR family DNA-binding transcriptional regulator, partial [Psychrosphaera sp.]|nr:YebC/PmpR family DNA-binding transcriptional regulator [Psychrosphaera sp.]